MVIYIHSFNLKINSGYLFEALDITSKINVYVQTLLSQGVARIAVPIFFIISGYLFFKEATFNYSLYRKKLKSKLFTLLIPYLFWSSFVVFIYIVLQSIPGTSNYFNNIFIINMPFIEIINLIFIEPRNYPLWFIRDLLYIFLISPIFYLLIKKIPLISILLLIIIWFQNIEGTTGVNLGIFKAEPFLFFFIGSYIALNNKQLLNYKIKNNTYTFILIFYFLLLNLKTIIIILNIDNINNLVLVMHKLLILHGIITFWFTLDRINKKYLLYLSSFTFIFFVFHEPMLTILRKGMYSILGNTSEISLFLYIISPIIIMSILICISLILKKYATNFYSIITGGR